MAYALLIEAALTVAERLDLEIADVGGQKIDPTNHSRPKVLCVESCYKVFSEQAVQPVALLTGFASLKGRTTDR